MEENPSIKMLAVVCTNCAHVLDILHGYEEEPLYIDEKCSCGHIGFTTIKITVKCAFERPEGRKPDFEVDGESWYIDGKY